MTAGVRYPTPPGRSTGRQPRFLILEGITIPVGMDDRPHIAALQLAVAAEGFGELAGRMEEGLRSSGDPEESSVLRRARASHHLIEGARILWIDDRPARAVVEAEVFRELGARVTWAWGKEEALKELGRRSPEEEFRVIVSDIARGESPDAGVRDLPEILKAAPGTPVIFYVGELRRELGVPQGAFGITNDPEKLVHLVFDGLERGRM